MSTLILFLTIALMAITAYAITVTVICICLNEELDCAEKIIEENEEYDE